MTVYKIRRKIDNNCVRHLVGTLRRAIVTEEESGHVTDLIEVWGTLDAFSNGIQTADTKYTHIMTPRLLPSEHLLD